MSIRIYTDGLANAAASEASRNEELSRAGAGSKQSVVSSSSEGGDQVQISSLSESIAAGSSQQDTAQAHRVAKIAAQYENGTYHVDSLQLSRALVSSALGVSSSGKA
jgi:anti-sigma28 factor (negative regulator of flagellin synthesis)